MINFLALIGHGCPLPPALLDEALEAARSARPFGTQPVITWANREGAAAMLGAGAETLEGFRDGGEDQAWWLVGEPLSWADDGCRVVTVERWQDRHATDYDGRFVALSVGPDGVRVWTDPSGVFPVYVGVDPGGRWTAVSPDAGVLRRLVGPAPTVDELAAASLVTFGFSLSDRTLGGDIVRLRPSTNMAIDWSGRQTASDHARRPDFTSTGCGFDPRRASRTLQAIVAATVEHAEDASLELEVGLTAGRDSRVLLAASSSQGLRPQCFTAVHPDGYHHRSRDAAIGRELAEIVEAPYHVLDLARCGEYYARPATLLTEVAERTDGTMSFEYSRFTRQDRWDRREIIIGGSGGELARSHYGLADDRSRTAAADSLLQRVIHGSPTPLTAHGHELIGDHVRGLVGQWADEGLALRLVNDRWYRHHDQRWTATIHGWANGFTRTVSPYLAARLLPDLVGASDADRAAERFHRAVVSYLAPQLLNVRFFQGGWQWWLPNGVDIQRPSPRSTLATKVAGEARRRLSGWAWIRPVAASARRVGQALDSPGAPMWNVIDRAAMQRWVRVPLPMVSPAGERFLHRVGTVAVAGAGS